MVTVENKLQNIQRELTAITLAIKKIVAVDLIDIKHVQYDSQYELLEDLLHILNTAKDVLDTLLCLSADN